jgi:hypothetical protein
MYLRVRLPLFVLFSLLLVLSSSGAAVADVPDVQRISAESIIDCGVPLGGRGFLLVVTVRHANPAVGHYVDKIEITVGKTTKIIDLQSQSSETFDSTVVVCEGRDYQPGQEITVRARAHCTINGWGEWSSSISVPEFAAPILVGLVTLFVGSLTIVSLRRHILTRRLAHY